ncbi:MAG: isopentenyl-diphosphate delta-isomerase [Paracoccaceae bacterium]|nr:isopentenyl-diphosphate delta-isomerase [Paracoccaceae bacterium]MDG1736409.1 isopentenyl-diphosphate delta-isomerase [Paracoccaceae bacterium]MDG2257724.1 isopentenyl-diphosphate delta-isomerase [Paracoccaceae bacterium]
MTTNLAAHIPAWVDGKLTPVGKLETHQRGLKHPAVSVMIMSGDEMLIQQRDLGKYHTPGLWANACCTHPFWGEDAKECAVRRLEEELGITGLELQHRANLEYRANVGNDLIEHEVVDLFVAWADLSLAVKPNPEEVMDWRWISLKDLMTEVDQTPDAFTPWFKIYLSDYAETLKA